MIVPVILAGGSGTRLWPLSRQFYPKQFMRLVGDDTLLQSTAQRLNGVEDVAPPLILCNEEHRFTVAEQMRRMEIQPSTIILEPVGRNTAPAIAVAAVKAEQLFDDPVLLILPADHYIADTDAFATAVRAGAGFAGNGYLVTFGIVPSAPETGYGYIRKGAPIEKVDGDRSDSGNTAWTIAQFVEKPDRAMAETYVAGGEYCWNSGMFMFSTDRFQEELQRYAPEMMAACRATVAAGSEDLDFFRLDRKTFETCPADSVDYAVMEHTESGAMIALDSGWNDLGSWEALWQVGAKDEDDNVVIGDVCLQDVHRSYVHGTGRLVTAVGLDDHVVVETDDAVFVAPRHRVQDIKKLVTHLKEMQRPEALTHRKVYRPWGAYEDMVSAQRFQVKRITVKAGGKISLQKHYHRAEHWVVVSGTARVTKGEEQFLLREDESVYIPEGVVHRLENPGKIALELIEVRSGSYLAEDDIVRLDDAYGRTQM